jgi:hypothetical protein
VVVEVMTSGWMAVVEGPVLTVVMGVVVAALDVVAEAVVEGP